MNQPYRFRYVNEITGAFVLAILVLLIAGVIAAGHSRRWFERQDEFRVRFPPEGTYGLQFGAEVYLLGTPVGSLRRIDVDPSGAMTGQIRIRGEFAGFIRADSVAVIKKKFGVAGDSFLEITTGPGAALDLNDKIILPCRKDTELTEMAADLLNQVRDAVLPAAKELEQLISAYRRLGESLESPDGNLQRSLDHIESLLAGLERGEGAAGGLLKDPALLQQAGGILDQVSDLLGEVKQTLKEAQKIVDDVQRTTAVLPDAAATVRGEMRDVPGVVLQTRSTLREAETVLTGVQHHWLLRGAMQQKNPVDALSIHDAPPPEEK